MMRDDVWKFLKKAADEDGAEAAAQTDGADVEAIVAGWAMPVEDDFSWFIVLTEAGRAALAAETQRRQE